MPPEHAADDYEALLQFLYMAPVGLAQIRTDGNIELLNPLCAQLLLPVSATGVLSNLFETLCDIAPHLQQDVRAFQPLRGRICDAVHLRVPPRSEIHAPAQVLSLTLLKLDSERLMAVIDDVTATLERERELRQSQAWIQTLVMGQDGYAMVSLDDRGVMAEWNPSVERVMGFGASQTIGRSYAMFYPDDVLKDHWAQERLREAGMNGWSLEEGWMVRPDGARYWASILLVPYELPDGATQEPAAYQLVIRDISSRREAHDALRQLVTRDELTGLANRRAFFNAANATFDRCVRARLSLCMVVLDTDHFKTINDTFGHAAGDAVLRHLGKELSETFRVTDIVGRLGGEEFAVLLPGVSEADAMAIANRLCRHIHAQPVAAAGVPIRYTVSAGVASLWVGESDSVDALLARADAAMYAAKGLGRNRAERWTAEGAVRAARPAPESPPAQDSGAYEALLGFMYQAPIGLAQTALDGTFLMMNPMCARLLMPFAPGGAMDNLFGAFAEVAPHLRETLAERLPDSPVLEKVVQVPAANVEGAVRPAQTLALRFVRLGDSTFMVSLADVTKAAAREQVRLDSRLRDVSRTDALTGLPNRAVILDDIQRSIERAQQAGGAEYRWAVMFVNADRFNQVNVTLGRQSGDDLLLQMGQRLAASIRPGDSTALSDGSGRSAARVGGDEFVVVLHALRDAEDVHSIAQRLIDALAEPYAVGDQEVKVHVSMGVVCGCLPDDTADSILLDASIAMREAKRLGGSRFALFEPAMKERVLLHDTMERELRRALAAGELYVVYQPIVSFNGTDPDGVEALVRWRHPTRGNVSPVEFIGIAEETGLIGALGAFVLSTACAQFMSWKRLLGLSAPGLMSVNLSRAELSDPALVPRVRDALHNAGMDAACLQLEVTESLAAQDTTVQAKLHQLKALGLSLALDDFGTGYSSLACLDLLPVDVVKIDRSFVSQIETNPHRLVLIEATIRVAQSLSMRTVAEGIETEMQAAQLRRLQCDKGQGYLFSKPLTAPELEAWWRAR